MAVLACPVCKGDLELQIAAEKDEEILSGPLACPRCPQVYPITEGIPNLPPELRPQNWSEPD